MLVKLEFSVVIDDEKERLLNGKRLHEVITKGCLQAVKMVFPSAKFTGITCNTSSQIQDTFQGKKKKNEQ